MGARVRRTWKAICTRLPFADNTLAALRERGQMFIDPTIEVYKGMGIGENARPRDLDVNITKEKKQSNMRASSRRR